MIEITATIGSKLDNCAKRIFLCARVVNSAKRFSVDHEKVKGGHMAEFLATHNELQQSAATGTAKTPLSV